jgi:uncharacterized protein YdiU (UPF0061 family)
MSPTTPHDQVQTFWTPLFDNTYARELEGFYAACAPDQAPKAELIYWNTSLATQLGWPQDLNTETLSQWAKYLGGSEFIPGSQPIAQAYAGHQFGGFSPQLGDGRAHLLGEFLDPALQRWDLALKGSGRTPFSRSGDGKAALGPMLREVLMSEALAAVGIDTTRSLAVVATGEVVYREQQLPGAVLTRIAKSHLRVGTFQFFAARGDMPRLRQLCNYAITRHDPDLLQEDLPQESDRILKFLERIVERQAQLIAKWMGYGFIHGVMNTDNMTLSGETIDFGPCAMMEHYDPRTVYSSIDHQGRYAFGNQPRIGHWNLAQLGQSLLGLLPEPEGSSLQEVIGIINRFPEIYTQALHEVYAQKLGLPANNTETAAALATEFLDLMQAAQADWTLSWRSLSAVLGGNHGTFVSLFASLDNPENAAKWLQKWQAALGLEIQQNKELAKALDQVNPIYIPRNHLVEEALQAATRGDLEPFENLLKRIQNPYQEISSPSSEDRYAHGTTKEANRCYQTFCGT